MGWCMDENEEEWCKQFEKERRKVSGEEDGKKKDFLLQHGIGLERDVE